MNGFEEGLPVHHLNEESDETDEDHVQHTLKQDLIHSCQVCDLQCRIEYLPDANEAVRQQEYRQKEEAGENHNIDGRPWTPWYGRFDFRLRPRIGFG